MSYVSKAYDKMAAVRAAQATAAAAWRARLEAERAAERALSSKELRAQAQAAHAARAACVDRAVGGNNPLGLSHGPCAQGQRLEEMALRAEAEGR